MSGGDERRPAPRAVGDRQRFGDGREERRSGSCGGGKGRGTPRAKVPGPEPGERAKIAREVAELAREGARRAIGRMIELIEHEDPRIAMAAANTVFDRAFGKSAPPAGDENKPPPDEAAAAPTVEALARLSADERAELRTLVARAAGRSRTDGPPVEPRRRARKP